MSFEVIAMRTNELSRVRAVRHGIVGLVIACGLLLGTQGLVAHHAGTMFSDETKEITGTVKEFQFTNPHSWIQVMVETKPGAPPQEWSVEWGGLRVTGTLPSAPHYGAQPLRSDRL